MRKKDIIFCIILLMLQFIPTACRDDYFMNEEIGEGNATLSVTLCFDQEDAALGTTRAEGGDEGNAIQNINSLCMLFYDTTGKLVHNYIVKGEGLVIDPDVSGWSYNLEDNRIDEDKDEQGNQFEDSKTGTAMFKLRPIKRGKYYIYAVANMGDLTQSPFSGILMIFPKIARCSVCSVSLPTVMLRMILLPLIPQAYNFIVGCVAPRPR